MLKIHTAASDAVIADINVSDLLFKDASVITASEGSVAFTEYVRAVTSSEENAKNEVVDVHTDVATTENL